MEETTAAVDPDLPCKHMHFISSVAVGRIGEGDPDSGGMPKAYLAEVSVNCHDCGEKFRFTGVQAGMSFDHPMCSVDETTLIAPVRPASADPDFGIGLPGYAFQVVKR